MKQFWLGFWIVATVVATLSRPTMDGVPITTLPVPVGEPLSTSKALPIVEVQRSNSTASHTTNLNVSYTTWNQKTTTPFPTITTRVQYLSTNVVDPHPTSSLVSEAISHTGIEPSQHSTVSFTTSPTCVPTATTASSPCSSASQGAVDSLQDDYYKAKIADVVVGAAVSAVVSIVIGVLTARYWQVRIREAKKGGGCICSPGT